MSMATKQLLIGAFALGSFSFLAGSQGAQAYNLYGCGTGPLSDVANPLGIESNLGCSYVLKNDGTITGQTNDDKNAASGTSFSTEGSGGKINVNNVNTSDEGGVEGFFGHSDWDFVAKDNTTGDPVSEDDYNWFANIDEGDKSIFDVYNEFLVVVKSGNKSTMVGYLLDQATIESGTFSFSNITTILDNRNRAKNQAVSHFSFYARFDNAPPPVPVPAPVAVLPILGGVFGAASRRKSGKSEDSLS